jgi:hypothetical protein
MNKPIRPKTFWAVGRDIGGLVLIDRAEAGRITTV